MCLEPMVKIEKKMKKAGGVHTADTHLRSITM